MVLKETPWFFRYAPLKLITYLVVLLFKIICILCNALLKFVYRKPEKSVKGEIVLVTGAGQGLGRQIALQYANLDAIVVCLDINPESNSDTVAKIKKTKKNAFGYVCDVGNENQVKSTITKILEEIGDISIVINNAGIVQTQSFLKLTSDEIRRIFNVNLMAHFWVLQMVLPTMLKNNRGHIVAVASALSLFGLHNVTTYCSSKFAVIGLMKSLEDEVRQNSNNNIKFTTVLPGLMDTQFCANFNVGLPYLSNPISAVKVAQCIISGQRRDLEEVLIPKSQLLIFRFASLLPNAISHSIVDAMDITFDL